MRKLIVLVSLLLVTAAAIAGYQGGGYDAGATRPYVDEAAAAAAAAATVNAASNLYGGTNIYVVRVGNEFWLHVTGLGTPVNAVDPPTESTTNWAYIDGTTLKLIFSTNYASIAALADKYDSFTLTQGVSNHIYESGGGSQINFIVNTNYAGPDALYSVAFADIGGAVNDNAALSNALAAKFGAIGSITGGNSNWVYNVGETLHFILSTNYASIAALADKYDDFTLTQGTSNYIYESDGGSTINFILDTNYYRLGSITPSSIGALPLGQLFTGPGSTGSVTAVNSETNGLLGGDGNWHEKTLITAVGHLAFLLNGPGSEQWGTNLPPTTLIEGRVIATNGAPISIFDNDAGFLTASPLTADNQEATTNFFQRIGDVLMITFKTNYVNLGVDIDAATLDGNDSAYYENHANITNVPVSKEGTFIQPYNINAAGTNFVALFLVDSGEFPNGIVTKTLYVDTVDDYTLGLDFVYAPRDDKLDHTLIGHVDLAASQEATLNAATVIPTNSMVGVLIETNVYLQGHFKFLGTKALP